MNRNGFRHEVEHIGPCLFACELDEPQWFAQRCGERRCLFARGDGSGSGHRVRLSVMPVLPERRHHYRRDIEQSHHR